MSEDQTIDLQPEKAWCLTLNGSPVETLEELTNLCSELYDINDSTRRVLNSIWRAQWTANPNEVLDRAVDEEPVIVACCDYTPVPRPAGVIVAETITPTDIVAQPVSSIIVKAAAGALLSGGLGDHFFFNETGALSIDPENPPSLDEGYEMMRRVFSTEETGDRLKNFSRWNQGGLLAELQIFYGDRFEWDAVCAATERTYNTLNACLNTHIRWAHRKREALSWTHHKEVEFSRLEDEDKEWVLDQSVRYGLVVAEQRKLQSFVRTYGRPEEGTLPESKDELIERLNARSANRNFMFMLQNVWYEYRGPFEHIPNGASQVLNADTRQVLDREGNASRPITWVPVGVEVPALRGHAAVVRDGIEEARETGEAPRRSHGGRTQTAAGPTGPPITQDEAEEAREEAEEIIQQAEAAIEEEQQPASCEGWEFRLMNGDQFLLAVNMMSYPMGMPEHIQYMLDTARDAQGMERVTAIQNYINACEAELAPF